MNLAMYRETSYSCLGDDFGAPPCLGAHTDPHEYTDSSGMSVSSTSEDSRLMDHDDSLMQRWNSHSWADLTAQAQEYQVAMDFDPQVGNPVSNDMQGIQFMAAPVSSTDMANSDVPKRPFPLSTTPTMPFYTLPALTEYEQVVDVPNDKEHFFRTLIPPGSGRGGVSGSLMISNSCAAGDIAWLRRHAVTSFINCSDDCDHFRSLGLRYSYIPLSKLDDASPYAYFEEAGRVIRTQMEAGEVVLLFCPEALGRALCIAFAYMICQEKMTLLQCVSYTMCSMKAKMFFTTAQQRALFEFDKMIRRPKEVTFLKQLARPKPLVKKKEPRVMVKVKVKALPKKKLIRGTRPLSSIKAEDIRRSLMLPPNSPFLRRNFSDSKLAKEQARILDCIASQPPSETPDTPPAAPDTPMGISTPMANPKDVLTHTPVEVPYIPRSGDSTWISGPLALPPTPVSN